MSAQTMSQTSAQPRREGARRARRHLRPVQDGPKSHPLVFLLLYAAILVGAIGGALSLNALAAQDAVSMIELEEQVGDAERTYGELVAQVAALEDPERIRGIAEQMGMRPADQRHLVPQQELPQDRAPAEAQDPLKPVVTAQR